MAAAVAPRRLASDATVRDYAAGVGAVTVTKDEDFAVRRLLIHGPSVIWLRVVATRGAESCSVGSNQSCRESSMRSKGETLVEIVSVGASAGNCQAAWVAIP